MNEKENKMLMKQYSAGDVIIKEGENNTRLGKIVKGKVALYFNYEKENEFLVGALSDGKCYNEIALLTQKPCLYTVVALSDVLVMEVKGENFQEFITKYPQNAIGLMENMAKNILLLQKHIELLSEEVINENQTNERNKKLAIDVSKYNIYGIISTGYFDKK